MKSAASILALALISAKAAAVPVTYDITATGLGAGINLAGLPFTVEVPPELNSDTLRKTTFVGSITIDHGSNDELPGDPTRARYSNVLSFSVNVNGFNFVFDPMQPLAIADTFIAADNPPPVGYLNNIQISARAFQPSWLVSLGAGDQYAEIHLSHNTAYENDITSDELPSSLDAIDRWRIGVLIRNYQTGQHWNAGAWAQLTPVPEPGTFALAVFGLAAIGLRRRVWRGARA